MGKLYKEYLKTYALTKENSDGFIDVVSDIYYSPEVQSLAQYEQHMDIDRLRHVTGVAYLAYKTCRHFGLDYEKAARAAAMHDLFYYDWHEGDTGKWHHGHGYKHPRYAALNAAELVEGISEHELKIIRRHMWPLTIVPPTTAEGMIVSLSDKYCAVREFFYSVSKRYKQKFLADVERIKENG